MEEMTFEKAMERLQQISDILAKNQCSLDEGIKLFEEGIQLSAFCDEKLKACEEKLKELSSRLENGNEN